MRAKRSARVRSNCSSTRSHPSTPKLPESLVFSNKLFKYKSNLNVLCGGSTLPLLSLLGEMSSELAVPGSGVVPAVFGDDVTVWAAVGDPVVEVVIVVTVVVVAGIVVVAVVVIDDADVVAVGFRCSSCCCIWVGSLQGALFWAGMKPAIFPRRVVAGIKCYLKHL